MSQCTASRDIGALVRTWAGLMRLAHLVAQLQAKHEGVWVQWGQLHQQAAKAAAHVSEADLRRLNCSAAAAHSCIYV